MDDGADEHETRPDARDEEPTPEPTEDATGDESEQEADDLAARPDEDVLDRSVVSGSWLRKMGVAAACVIAIGIVLAALLWLLSRLWVGVLPTLLALIVTSVLWPPVAWLRARGLPPSLAALLGLTVPFVAIAALFTAMAPSVIRQITELVERGAEGLRELQVWAQGPPVNLQNEQVQEATDAAIEWMQGSSAQIASGVFTGVSAVTSALLTLVLILVLTFFFLKDGPSFLPWLRRVVGRSAGRHLTESGMRAWRTLSGFIRTQAIVSAVDAVFIGIGLAVLQVPLAFALALLTFFGGFIPIVGAVAVGVLAVLVALVGNGWATALAVLGLILVVQQVESNVLQPYLQGKSMQLHAGVILLSVAVGGTIFGIIGAFLAVPIAAVVATVLRYVSEQIDLRTGELAPEDVSPLTPEGAQANLRSAEYARARRAQTLTLP